MKPVKGADNTEKMGAFGSKTALNPNNLSGLIDNSRIHLECRELLWMDWKKADGSPSRARTCDKAINSRLLYQLSYRGSARRAAGI